MSTNYGFENQALKIHALSVFWLQNGKWNSVEGNTFTRQNTSEERQWNSHYPLYWNLMITIFSLIIYLSIYYHITADGWRRFAFLTRWNSVHLQVLLSATPQRGMFPEISHSQALLGSLVSISWKFQFTKIVSEFVINF